MGVRELYRRLAEPAEVRELRRRVESLAPEGAKGWYYPIDFGHGVRVRDDLRADPHHGESNWRFVAEHLPPLAGLRVLDVGANAGLYDIRMAEAGAREVVGVDRDVRQAEFVRDWFARDGRFEPERVRFVAADARSFDFGSLGGRFDLACLFCVVYHLAEDAATVVRRVADVADAVVLQGNLPRLDSPKYRDRPFMELAGVEGMERLLRDAGLDSIEVVAPDGHPKPLVLGRRA